MLACIVLAFSIGVVSGATYHYPESIANGWTGDCPTGNRQSPIDLDPSCVATVHAPITYGNYFNGHKHNKHMKGLLMNNGHTVVWYPNHKDTAKLKGGSAFAKHCPYIKNGPYGGVKYSHRYYLAQLHFHWGEVEKDDHGSEHTVGGMAYPLEMHMVHVEDKFIAEDGTIDWGLATADPVGLAVLGVFFKVQHDKPQNNAPLQKVDDDVWNFHYHADGHAKRSVEEIEEDEDDHYHNLNMRSLSYGMMETSKAKKEKRSSAAEEDEMKLKLNIGAFLRKATRNGRDKTMSTYWTYKGSLTTPGCNEVVTWVVFQRALPIAQVQVNAFASLFPNNYRPTQNGTDHMLQCFIHKPVSKNP